MFNKILVPLDGSQLAEVAIPVALELAAKFASEIILLRVAPITPPQRVATSSGPDAQVYNELAATMRRHERKEAQGYLQTIQMELTEQGFKVESQIRSADSPPKAILAVTQQQEIDIVVMSTHGRGGLARWVYGSVADKVLRYSPIPVLLVRAEDSMAVDMPAIVSEADLHLQETD